MAKKKWGIKEPVQWKHGCWYSNIVDPDTKEIVYERLDFTKKMCFDACVFWAVEKNKLEEGDTNAEPTTVG